MTATPEYIDAEREPGLPQNDEAERAVLGACIIDPRSIVDASSGPKALKPGHFKGESHPAIYRAILACHARGGVDLVTVSEELRSQGKLDAVGGQSFLAGMSDTVGTTSHTRHYADIVWDKAVRRSLLERTEQVARLAYDEGLPVEDVMARAEKAVLNLTTLRGTDLKSFGQIWDEMREAYTTGSPAVPYHLDTLNRLTAGGMREGLFTLLGGLSGTAKTRTAVALMRSLIKRGRPQVMFSFEMTGDQLAAIFCTQELSVCPSGLLRPEHAEDDPFGTWPGDPAFEAMGEKAHGDWDRLLHVYDSASLSVDEMDAYVRYVAERHGKPDVHVDFATLIAARGRSRTEEMEGVAVDLAGMYKRHKLRGMVLTQMTERQDGKLHSKYGKDLESVSQTAYYFERPDTEALEFKQEWANPETGEVESYPVKIVNRKNRWGKASGHTASLWWNGNLAMYEDPKGDWRK